VSLSDEVLAIRSSAAMSDCTHVAAVRISGPGAFEAVDRVCPREIYVQDGQALHTLLLDDAAHPVADVYVCADGDDFLIVGETRGHSLLHYLRDVTGSERGVSVQDLTPTHEVVSLNGPYAWELLAEVLTPEIIGLPYLGLFHSDDIVCLRGGKAGEYGYDMLVPRDGAEELRERIVECGVGFDLRIAGLEALDACALENWFFNVRREGGADVTPLELQLQWRVSYRKSYPGSAALLARRSAGAQRRVSLVGAQDELVVGDPLVWGERPVGDLLAAARSPTLDAWLGIALLDAALAHPGLSDFAVAREKARIPLTTISAPPINNRSLFVDPQRHTYRTRDRDRFPPLRPTP
jgi:glycine cleavage system aminomethyltransferase T